MASGKAKTSEVPAETLQRRLTRQLELLDELPEAGTVIFLAHAVQRVLNKRNALQAEMADLERQAGRGLEEIRIDIEDHWSQAEIREAERTIARRKATP